MTLRKVLDYLGFGIIAVFGVIALAAFFGSEDPETKSETDAYFYAQKAVEGVLKAPSTAEFAKFHNSKIIPAGTNGYQVVSYVDSENSFGAMIRSHYKVRVEFSGGKVKTSILEFE